MPYPGIWFIVSVAVMALCAGFFYRVGEHERSGGWKWALVSFGIWALIFFVLGRGLLWQLPGQAALLVFLTFLNMTGAGKRKARITR